jgi:GntR family transcriptional regulator
VRRQPGAHPLYAQIASELRARMVAGTYPPGARLPSEHELAAEFGVGRPTVRQATELLVRDGALARRQGSGTYVNVPAPEIDLFSASGTLSSFARSGLDLQSSLLGRVQLKRIGSSAEQPFRGRPAFFVTRLSTLDATPVLLEEMYFDPNAFPDLDRQVVDGGSLSTLAREHYRLRPTTQEQRFSVCRLDAKRAAALRVADETAILHVQRSVDFSSAPAAVFAELFCRTDRISFTQRLDLGSAPPSPLFSPSTSAQGEQR